MLRSCSPIRLAARWIRRCQPLVVSLLALDGQQFDCEAFPVVRSLRPALRELAALHGVGWAESAVDVVEVEAEACFGAGAESDCAEFGGVFVNVVAGDAEMCRDGFGVYEHGRNLQRKERRWQ